MAGCKAGSLKCQANGMLRVLFFYSFDLRSILATEETVVTTTTTTTTTNKRIL
jgi:hypothetical protein